MEENKYYFPGIDEFHIGFICEMNTTPNNWVKVSITLNHFLHLEKWLKENTIRVKYLDKADIESLGWKFTMKSIDDWYEIDLIDTQLRLSSGHYISKWIMHHDRSHRFLIEGDLCYNLKIISMVNGCDEESFFEGIIKNKSELSILMKQLGIFYEKEC